MINKTALLFPGEGSQWDGMGNDVYRNYKTAREIYDKACEILKLNRIEGSSLPFDANDLKITYNQQIAIFVTNHVFYELSRQRLPDLQYVATAGHSLGEYNALVASGALGFEEALKLVQKRVSICMKFLQE